MISKITKLQDLLDPLKELIHHVINANYAAIEREGWGDPSDLSLVIEHEREQFIFNSKLTGSQSNQAKTHLGLFWLRVPPDQVLIEALSKAYPISFDESDSFFNEKIKANDRLKVKSSPYTNFRLGDVLDGKLFLPDSEWQVNVRMRTKEESYSSLFLIIEMSITSDNLLWKIINLESM